MGLSTKQVSNDHHHNGHDHWGQSMLESGGGVVDNQLPKPNTSKRKLNQQQNQTEPLKCPRCSSMNTKFCYYNNYNKSQPRHFCKACKRHWTEGGTLRNVPVGGGRKNKRLKISSNPATTATTTNTTAATNTTATKSNNFPLASLMNNPSSISSDAINNLSGKNWMSSIKNTTFNSSKMFSLPQDHSLQFSFSSLSPFDTIPCSFPSSNLSLGNNFYEYNTVGELDHVESTSTVTTVTPPPPPPTTTTTTTTTISASVFNSVSWQQSDQTTNDAAEMPNYWNWNVADPFVSSNINVSWDEL